MKTSVAYKLAQFARKYGHDFKALDNPDVIEMRSEIASLDDGTITFQVSGYEDGSWSATSTNVEGIITGSRNIAEIDDVIRDAVFTYYGIPAKYADDRLLKHIGQPINTEREVLVTT